MTPFPQIARQGIEAGLAGLDDAQAPLEALLARVDVVDLELRKQIQAVIASLRDVRLDLERIDTHICAKLHAPREFRDAGGSPVFCAHDPRCDSLEQHGVIRGPW